MHQTKRATIYLEASLHQALKLKAVENDSSISEIVNDAVKAALREDIIDLEAIRLRKKEKTRSFETFVREMKKNGFL